MDPPARTATVGRVSMDMVTVDLTPSNTADSSSYTTTYGYGTNGKIDSITQSDGSSTFTTPTRCTNRTDSTGQRCPSSSKSRMI